MFLKSFKYVTLQIDQYPDYGTVFFHFHSQRDYLYDQMNSDINHVFYNQSIVGLDVVMNVLKSLMDHARASFAFRGLLSIDYWVSI